LTNQGILVGLDIGGRAAVAIVIAIAMGDVVPTTVASLFVRLY